MGKKAKVVRRRKKRKLSKNIGILSVVVVIVVIITLSILNQSEPQTTQKEPADKYFKFPEVFAEAVPSDETNSSIFIKQVWCNITAVEGKATEVYIRPLEGLAPMKELPDMIQGGSEIVQIGYPSEWLSKKEDEGYPVNLDVICHEAEGQVTIYITEFFPPLFPFGY